MTGDLITTVEELDALRQSGVATMYLFQRGDHTILAWETEDGSLVGIRPWDEDDGQFADSVPPATRETFAFAVRDLTAHDDEDIVPLRLLWHDGLADRPALSDAALIEEAARRGMTVHDAEIKTVTNAGRLDSLRQREGWPTPNHMRKAAEALDALTPARYGDVLRWFADRCDEDVTP